MVRPADSAAATLGDAATATTWVHGWLTYVIDLCENAQVQLQLQHEEMPPRPCGSADLILGAQSALHSGKTPMSGAAKHPPHGPALREPPCA